MQYFEYNVIARGVLCPLQPEALSRCSTPMSPTGGAPLGAPVRRSSLASHDLLPFFEVDVCTASKQEHIVAVVSDYTI